MPIYQYVAVTKDKAGNRAGCDYCRGGFEERQRMSDEPLRVCPKCSAPVERVITSVGISTHGFSKSLMSDKSLKKHGFTKLVNEGDGKFRKL